MKKIKQRRRNPRGLDLNLILIAGAGYYAYTKGWFNSLLGGESKSGTGNTVFPGNTGGTITTPTVPTSGQIAAWAGSINVPVCVGTLFVNDFGRLPSSLDEMNAWGTAKGIRQSNGIWAC